MSHNYNMKEGIKMDFVKVLNENFVVVVFMACLIIGYIIKTSLDMVPNKYIPTILAVFGAILNGITIGFSVESIVYGALMGLASTGMHQVFKNFVENKKTAE